MTSASGENCFFALPMQLVDVLPPAAEPVQPVAVDAESVACCEVVEDFVTLALAPEVALA